ncbi:MAG: protein tyrosine phosphatase family protein [Cocleimonas sp.]|nr:protein tyrosine phosphatase family protein [Cocleimonas sp.]
MKKNQSTILNDVSHCLNYTVINEDISSSGQPTPIQIDAIATSGFQSRINLALHDSTDALYEEGGIVSEASMNYFHVPAPFDAPTKAHLKLFLDLMTVLQGKKIGIHCAFSWRASAFLYHY